MDDLLAEFLAESAENLESIGTDLVRWEERPDDRALLDRVFRVVHTIKGTCGFLNLPRLGLLAHGAEGPLARARDGTVVPGPDFITTMLAAIDAIRAILDALAEHGREPAGDDGALLARIAAVGADVGFVPRAPQDRRSPAPAVVQRAASSVRISLSLLDQLMESVSELVLARNSLVQLSGTRLDAPMAAALERLSMSVTEVQDCIIRTRMQPIETLFAPLPRMVRDLAAELGKHVRLELEGGSTELDRQLIEAIRDPIAHMIRNAVDHGLEPPAERRKAGKTEEGTIRVAAHQAGGQIVIELTDDGRGLDIERLRSRVIELGLKPMTEAMRLSPAAARQLIFEPGLSTAAQVTSISGRGVGMDVVRSNIDRIGGTVEVDGGPDGGTRFVIRLPLTLSIVPALLIRSGDMTFAMPQASILEVVRIQGETRSERVAGRDLLRLRDTHYPSIDLAGELGLARPAEAGFAILVRPGALAPFAVLVEGVIDQEEIVIKPVAPAVAATGLFSGAAVLGDGQPVLVTDLAGLAERAGIAETRDDRRDRQPASTDAAEALILFETGDGVQRAMPAALVSRVEPIAPGSMQYAAGRYMLVRAGETIPVASAPGIEPLAASHTLIIEHEDRRAAFPIQAVRDIVVTRIIIERPAVGGALVGTATLDGTVTEILDPFWYLAEAEADGAPPSRGTVLCLMQGGWVSLLLRPALESAGYQVLVAGPDELENIERPGDGLDVILCDEDGAERLDAAQRYAGVPMVHVGNGTAGGAALKAGDRAGIVAAVLAAGGRR
jgi:two-component system chemotaxis sensor kinase CheA